MTKQTTKLPPSAPGDGFVVQDTTKPNYSTEHREGDRVNARLYPTVREEREREAARKRFKIPKR